VAVAATIVDRTGRHGVDNPAAEVGRRIESDDYFWLDLHGVAEDELRDVADPLGLHPHALESALEFGHRARADDYDGLLFLVVFGWSPDDDGLVEMHVLYSERFLVTVHHDESPGLRELEDSCASILTAGTEPVLVLHRLLDGLTESFTAPLEEVEDRLEAIEAEIVESPNDRFVGEILDTRRRVAMLRKVLVPERDVLGRISADLVPVPGLTDDARRYFRDVHDDLTHLVEVLDTVRELITGTLDVYLSAASNRLGIVTKQLTVIATIFLPLTFITGFFGQNFGWLVRHVSSWEAFVLLGLGLEVLAVLVIVLVFRQRRLF
jgi:magnesium transporter